MISAYRFGPGQHMYYPQIFFCFRLSLDLQDQASKDSLYELIGRFGFLLYNNSN